MKWLTKEWKQSPDLRFGQLLINKGLVEDSLGTWNAEISDYLIPHEIMRKIQTWGTLGKDRKSERKYIFIKDLDTDHIKAILKTEKHIKQTPLEDVLKAELKYRKKKK